MGSSGSSPSIKSVEKRYAPYIENYHYDLLGTLALQRNAVIYDSPFTDYDFLATNEALFGTGYIMSNFSSLFEMFGKFMAGLDIEVFWSTSFDKVVSRSEIDIAISTEIELVDDKIIKGSLTDFQVDMRNMNAVSSSSFIVGKAVIENKRLNIISKISLDLKEQLLSITEKEYAVLLNWEKKIIATYAEIMKTCFIGRSNIDNTNYTFASNNSLWPFTILSYEGQALGAMQSIGGYRQLATKRKRSNISKLLLVASYTVSGAAIGGQIGGGYGAIIGAVIGFIVGMAIMLLE